MQQVILVDEHDKFTGTYLNRDAAHTGKGIHHRAFVVVVSRDNGDILLQKRKHTLWDGFWDVSAISHPLHFPDHDETYEEAGNRALQKEMGIPTVQLTNSGGFNYFATYKDTLCENEYCAILTAAWNGPVAPNPTEVYEYTWMPPDAFCDDLKTNPKKYTPWAMLTAQQLYKEYF